MPAATVDIMRAVPAGFADLDGDTLTYQYQWLINGSAGAGATTAQRFNVAGRVQLNDRVDVDVRASDGNGGTSPVGARRPGRHQHQLDADRRHRLDHAGDAADESGRHRGDERLPATRTATR